MATLGFEDRIQEATILNRIIRYCPETSDAKEAMEIEADHRHVDLLQAELNLAQAKGVDTPRVKHPEKAYFDGQESRILEGSERTLYRSAAMRLSYLGQDRPDLQECSKYLAQKKKEPREFDLTELKRAVPYLRSRPRAVLRFERQPLPHSLDGWVDSDYAGDVVTRKSTSGLAIQYGGHCVKTSSTVQEPIGLSSGESEFYACVRGGCYLLGIQAILLDWCAGTRCVLKLKTDSAAAKGMCTRRGLGRQRHISTRYLWLQDRISRGDLAIEKVGTADQRSDFLTKATAVKLMLRLSEALGLSFRSGKATAQKETLSVATRTSTNPL